MYSISNLQKVLDGTLSGSSFKDILNSIDISPSYPPCNLYKIEDESGQTIYKIEVGATGFKKEWLNIELDLDNNLLIIEGNIPKELKSSENRLYIVQNLARRNFKNKYSVPDYSEVISTSLSDGLLELTLKVNKPSNKTQKINIE